MDFAILRFTRMVNERIALKIDLYYQRSGDDGWIPAAWDIITMDTDLDRPRLNCHASVTLFQINPPLADTEFQLAFPVGTRVRDLRATPAEGGYYIVRNDEQKRKITPDELRRGATYQQMVDTESGQAGVARISLGRLLGLAAVGGVGLIAVVWICLWWRRA
jgi:hypothetical protein